MITRLGLRPTRALAAVNTYRFGGAVLAAAAGLLAVCFPASSMATSASAATTSAVGLAVRATAVPPLVAWGDSQAILPNTPVAKTLSGLPSCAGRPEREPSFATALTDALRLFKSECPHHVQWLSLQENWDTKFRDNWAAISRYEAPLVANLSDPAAHKIALEIIRMSGDFDLFMLANNVVDWSAGESGCTSSQPLAGPGDKGTKAGDPGNCPPSTGPSYKLVISIPKLSISRSTARASRGRSRARP